MTTKTAGPLVQLPDGGGSAGGLSMGELNAAQRSAALALVSSALSREGFEKVQEIMEGDEVLKTSEGNNPLFGRDLYYISLLGAPSEKDPWMVQFGGHHLSEVAHALSFCLRIVQKNFKRAAKIGLVKAFGFRLRGDPREDGAGYGICQFLTEGIGVHRVVRVNDN